MMKLNSKGKSVFTILAPALLLLGSINSAQADDYSSKIRNIFDDQQQSDAQLLVSSAASNRLSVVRQLVEDGIDINTPAIGDGTALMIAIQQGNKTMVKELLALGADANSPSPGDGNPLIVASKYGRLDMIKILLDAGGDINANVKGDETPLINASRSNHLAVVEYLVENGADVNLAVKADTIRGNRLRSPLNQAASSEIREYLKSKGATY